MTRTKIFGLTLFLSFAIGMLLPLVVAMPISFVLGFSGSMLGRRYGR